MTGLNIRTNNVPRDLLCLAEFNAADQAEIRKQYDWMDADKLEGTCQFFKYRNCFYHLSDFVRASWDATGDLASWDGYAGDSYFSGTLIKFADEYGDRVIVGRYYC